jgi:predicted permease
MAVSELSLLALGLALTLAGCLAAGALRGWGRWPAIVACLVSGVATMPAVVFGGFRLAGSTVGSQHTRLAFFVSWLAGVAISVWLARVYARPEPPD